MVGADGAHVPHVMYMVGSKTTSSLADEQGRGNPSRLSTRVGLHLLQLRLHGTVCYFPMGLRPSFVWQLRLAPFLIRTLGCPGLIVMVSITCSSINHLGRRLF